VPAIVTAETSECSRLREGFALVVPADLAHQVVDDVALE
jgi:hypothetical protein